ncbi:153539dd-a6df-4d82-8931-23e958d66717 [Thermothielavioides terrestris]|uniref:153539dd-a6df-4d82-8931-23e958d66717 n=1 Tax=Thermothielavioides terrestris TaxID=2587410 RepID=A0A446BA65_9PEZI|nr:153539dd-a6df-4d82-8931-23e958d66717 [Thermothielavioides terrestris]
MEQPSPTQPNNDFNNTTPTSSSSTTTTTRTAFGTRRAVKNPAFEAKLAQMSLQLAPLVQLTTGQVHPAFPRTLLAFWLLTDEQLESLAHFYHQRTPCRWTRHYPCPVAWPPGMTLEEKRRKLGRFIGLRGCETPIERLVSDEVAGRLGRSEDEICEDARRARLEGAASGGSGRNGQHDEVDEVRRKMGWY